jgi:hypothetical protein
MLRLAYGCLRLLDVFPRTTINTRATPSSIQLKVCVNIYNRRRRITYKYLEYNSDWKQQPGSSVHSGLDGLLL